jgi:hypothetical protein
METHARFDTRSSNWNAKLGRAKPYSGTIHDYY